MNWRHALRAIGYTSLAMGLLLGLLWGIFNREQQQVQIQRDIWHTEASKAFAVKDIESFFHYMSKLEQPTWYEFKNMTSDTQEVLKFTSEALGKPLPHSPTLATEFEDFIEWIVSKFNRRENLENPG